MKKIALLGSLVALFGVSCGDSAPAVGSGAPFSSLSPSPSGLQLTQAVLDAMVNIPGIRSSNKASKTYELTCFPDGTGQAEISDDPSNTSVFIRASYNNCAIALVLNNSTYQEKVLGDFTLVNENQTSGHISVAFSVSGDIGFSVECSITGNQSASVTKSYEGSCVFRDADGTEIVMPGSNYPRLNTPLG